MSLEDLKTPCYIINKRQFNENCNVIEKAFEKYWNKEKLIFGYSIKTNHQDDLLQLAKARGWYAEAVSCGELELAINLGFDYRKIIFNGPWKNDMLLTACQNGGIVNLDNLDEVHKVCEAYRGQIQNTLRIGLRVNFDLEGVCPGETTAGSDVSRFGLCVENGDLEKAIILLKDSGIKIAGLHMHVSTKTRSLNVFDKISEEVCKIIATYQLQLSFIDIGGGFFGGQIVVGKPTMDEYAKTICTNLSKVVDSKYVTLILEPGVSVLSTAVTYLTKVVNVKNIRDQKIATLDGSLLHINPFMVNRTPVYKIINGGESSEIDQIVCGCTCMENDRFFDLVNGPSLDMNSFIEFSAVGAYTMSFNSEFILKIPKVYLSDSGLEKWLS